MLSTLPLGKMVCKGNITKAGQIFGCLLLTKVTRYVLWALTL